VSSGSALEQPACRLDGGACDGAVSLDGQILGTYLHGLFDHAQALAALLRWAGLADPAPLDVHELREASIERIADAVEAHLDIDALLRLLQPNREPASCVP